MERAGWYRRSHLFFLIVISAASLIYLFSNPYPHNHYDYTFRIAESMLRGHIGITEAPPRWLNEFVPVDGTYYSVFPLGAVLTMLPFALLKTAGLVSEMPGSLIAALSAAAISAFLLLTSNRYELSISRRLLLTAGIIIGTWTWVNLTMAGAWQLALGFAMVGEFGAIYFTLFDRRPFIAGLFFALAFGNRTEILLTAPIFCLFLMRGPGTDSRIIIDRLIAYRWLLFLFVPFLLGVLTLYYNYLRFNSMVDFGYARIPGVLSEPWYVHGIFSAYYVPRQAYEMLFKAWMYRDSFPYLAPSGFSSSILWSSPFLLFIFRFGSRGRLVKICAWSAIIVLTLIYWSHGNSGGWQFGYRYAMILLPWIFILLLESSPKSMSWLEWGAYGFSFVVNAYAVWLFHWTDYMKDWLNA
jgi:hypothetical protein